MCLISLVTLVGDCNILQCDQRLQTYNNGNMLVMYSEQTSERRLVFCLLLNLIMLRRNSSLSLEVILTFANNDVTNTIV